MRPDVMNMSQRLLQTRFIILFYTSVLFEVLILTIKIIKIFLKNCESIHNGCHQTVQQSAHRYSALRACIHLLTFWGLSTLLFYRFLKQVGVNGLAIVVSSTARPTSVSYAKLVDLGSII